MALALSIIFFLLWCASIVMILLGLIKPKFAIYWGRQEKKTRGRVFLYYGISSFVFFVIFMVSIVTFGNSLPDPTPEEVAAAQAEKAKSESAEKAENEAKEKEKAEAEAKKEAEAKAEKEAKEKAKAEAKAKKEAEEKAKKEAEEAKAKKEAEEKAKKEAQAKKEAAEKAAKSEESFKNSAIELNYNELARDPDSFKGEKVFFEGQVMQNMEDGNVVTLLLNVTQDEFGYWDDSLLVNYTMSKNDKRILEEDIIYLWGTVNGLITYESIFGQQITVPQIDGAYIEIVGN